MDTVKDILLGIAAFYIVIHMLNKHDRRRVDPTKPLCTATQVKAHDPDCRRK